MSLEELRREYNKVSSELKTSLGGDYFVENGYVKKFDDCHDIFMDTIKIREATSREQYLYDYKWELHSKIRKLENYK